MRIGKFVKSLPLNIFASIIIYCLDLLFVYKDQPDFKYRWLEFFIGFVAIIPLFLDWKLLKKLGKSKGFFTIKTKGIYKKIHSWVVKNPWIIIGLLLIISTRFILIKEYPFNGIGDELRDGGLIVQQLISGSIKNIFGYGSYNGDGLLLGTLNIPFQILFSNSTLAYKVGSAVWGSIDLILMFVLITKLTNKYVALAAAAIAASIPLHLYYSRSEVVVIMDSLGATCTLLSLVWYTKSPGFKKLLLIGFCIGMILGLHSALRPLALLAFIYTIVLLIKNRQLGYIPTFILTILITFGPRILFSDQLTLLNSNKLNFDLSTIFTAIPQSLGVYFFTSTSTHFYLQAPILMPFYALLFIIGVVALLKKLNSITVFVFLCLFILPITNSALTDTINADHRLMVLIPFIIAATSYGINLIEENIHNSKLILGFFYSFILFSVITTTYTFFYNEYASYSMFLDTRANNYQNYLSTYIGIAIQSNARLSASKTICISGNSFEIDHKERMHVKGYLNYVFPDVNFEYQTDNSLEDRSIAISNSCSSTTANSAQQEIMYCAPYQKFVCPLDQRPLKILILGNAK